LAHIGKSFQLGVWGLAVCWALSSAQGQPQDIAAHAKAAQEAQRTGDFATAIKEYTILSQLEPEVAEVYSNLGIAYYFHRQPEEAVQAFAKALQLKPNLVSALIFSGLAYYDLSNTAQALRALQQAVALAPTDPLAQTWLGFSYLAASQYDEAVEHFLAASKLQPDNPDIWYGLGHAYMEIGQREIQKLAQIAPDGARFWELAGDQWRLRGDLGKTEVFYREALRRRPNLQEARQSLNEVISRKGKPADLPPLSATSTSPSEQELAADQHYFRSRDCEQRAQAAFEKIGAIAPGSYRAHQVLAESLTAQQRFDEAIVEYQKVLQLKPGLSTIHMAIGDLFMRQGRASQAVKEYKAELRARPKAPPVLFRLGHAWLVLGDDQQAEKTLQEALACQADIPEIQRDLGKIYLRQHRYAQGIAALEAYARTRPEDASAHFLLMKAYKSVGDDVAANRQQRLFEKYSEDAKRRTQAQQAVQYFEQQREAP